MRCGAAVSLAGHTGQSDETHSPEEWASTVVRRISPPSSIAVVCPVAISCLPSALRTISRPLESEAYRNVRSLSLGNRDWIVAVSDFSGFVSSACALASAPAMVPIVSLDRCMGRLLAQDIEAHGPGFRPLSAYAMPDRFLGIFRHQPLELGLGVFVFEKGRPGPAKHAG